MQVNNKYRPVYHASVHEAWSNDPNGLIFHEGKVHLFFQHYPHEAQWGPMHWGHFSTEDFISWEEHPVALYPDRDYEVICGCCSGNSFEKDGKLWLMYTAAQPELQRQCLAYSEDGIHFEKVENNPVLSADMLDKEVSPRDFRDPKIIKKGDYYYCLAGTRIINPVLFKRRAEKIAKAEALKAVSPSAYNAQKEAKKEEEFTVVRIDEDHAVNPCTGEYDQNDLYHVPVLGRTEREALGNGNMILFRTKDFEHFEYLGKLFEPQEGFDKEFFILDGVYECPDYFTSNGTEIILASPQNLPQMGHKFQNVHSVIYMTGTLDFETGHFEIASIEDLDSGFDIYASQVVNMPDGRHVMIAWKEMWDRPYPTKKDNWVGTYTLPRELVYKDNHLYQIPVREIDNYRCDRIDREKIVLAEESLQLEGFTGRSIEIQASFIPGTAKKAGVKLFKGKEHETLVYYDAEEEVVVFDRSKSGIPLVTEGDHVRCCQLDEEEILRLQIFLDVSSVEVFINGGRYTMTANVYPDPDDTGVEFFAEGGVAVLLSATKYTIRAGNQRVSK